jgi:xylulokinase
MFLGIDLGTGSVKLMLVDAKGSERTSSRPYSIEAPVAGWAETDPGAWLAAIREAIQDLPPLAGLRAIGLSGQMHGIVPVTGRTSQPLGRAILWADQRGAPYLSRFSGMPEEMARRSLNASAAGMAATSLLWMKEERPADYARVDCVLFPKDYVRRVLTGDLATDYSDASGSLLYDFERKAWYDELISHLGLDRHHLPLIRQATEPAGTVTAEAAQLFGLPAGVPVATGGADAPVGMYGSDLTHPNEVQISLGTAAQISRPISPDRLPPRESSLNVFEGVEPSLRYRVAAMLNAGIALEWALRVLRLDWDTLYRSLEERGLDVEPDLAFLPYLSGERTPYMNPNARGAWTGLGLHHSSQDLMFSALLGVACSVRLGLETLGIEGVSTFRAVGGSLRYPYWRKLIASVLGRELKVSRQTDASARGAARVAAMSMGGGTAWDEAMARASRHAASSELTAPVRLPWIEDYFNAFKENYARLHKPS